MQKYSLTSETVEFNQTFALEGDLWIHDTEKNQHGFDRTTVLTIHDENNKTIKIRIDWCNFTTTDTKFSTLIIPETGKLFFGARFFWGLIDLKNIKIERQEECFVFWNFERHSDSIVVITELSAESMTLEGKTIDEVSIDPPFDITVFEDKIQFDSPVFGHTELKLK